MSGSEPTFRIDPIDPSEIEPRFSALIDRLEPLLQRDDVHGPAVAGGHRRQRERLRAAGRITNDGTIAVDTATLVELVLIGQAVRPG